MFILVIVLFYMIIRMVNKNIFFVKCFLFWLLVGLILVFISVFFGVVLFIVYYFGFVLMMNFLLFGVILFLFCLELFDISSNIKRDE